jgi:hypothetical protein
MRKVVLLFVVSAFFNCIVAQVHRLSCYQDPVSKKIVVKQGINSLFRF